MSKKNKTDFIDEDEFLSTVTMNKKGGCVRMGKPPQGNEEPSRNEDMQEESITSGQTGHETQSHPTQGREETDNKRTERQRGHNGTLARLKTSRENVQRMSAYISIDNHRRFSVAAGVYKTTIGQMVDAILDDWWEEHRDEVKDLYYQDRKVFEDT